ncbi:MAG: DUF21 domain-containing protein [Planctomycetes bacterium]|nr:DUF21 domain-containing protein [Planctomycetota bacterium]
MNLDGQAIAMLIAWAAVLLVCLSLSACFSGLEIGLYVMNKLRLDLRAEAGSRPARRIQKMLQNWNNLLTTLLIGNNIVNYTVAFAVSAIFAIMGVSESRAGLYTMLIVTPVLFVVGESLPKNLFQKSAELLVYKLAWLLRGAALVLNGCGLVPLVQAVSSIPTIIARRRPIHKQRLRHEGIAAVVAEGQASGVLTHSQTIMADRAMRMPQTALKDVMIPLKKIASVKLGVSKDEALKLIAAQPHSRLPMLDEQGRVVKILFVYDLVLAQDGLPPLEKAVEPLILSQDLNITDALYRMQRGRSPLAIVCDPSGRHAGMVTIKDLVEEIVGELEAW